MRVFVGDGRARGWKSSGSWGLCFCDVRIFPRVVGFFFSSVFVFLLSSRSSFFLAFVSLFLYRCNGAHGGYRWNVKCFMLGVFVTEFVLMLCAGDCGCRVGNMEEFNLFLGLGYISWNSICGRG